MKVLLAALLLTFVAGTVTMSSAYAELDIQTNGTHYLITGQQNNHLYGWDLTFGNNTSSTGTLMLDDTNTNKWVPVRTDGRTGDLEHSWYYDTSRTQFLDSIKYTIAEPEPDPVPEDFTICHKGKTITTNERSFPAHEAHGDTFGACEVIPTNSTALPTPIDKKDKKDEKHNPIDYNNLPNYDTFKVCHNNKIINVAANGVRYHLQHGDAQFECPVVPTPTTADKLNVKELDTLELYELLMRIFEELKNR